MTQLQWRIEGQRFSSQEEYEAGLRDKKLIASITDKYKLDNPEDIEKLYKALRTGKYQFESIVGRTFDDNVYELYHKLKKESAKAVEVQEAKNKPKEQIKLADFDKDMQRQIKNELRKRQLVRKFVVIGCLAVGIFCFGTFGYYYKASANSEESFESLAALKEVKTVSNKSKNSEVKVHLVDKNKDIPDILPEYEALYNKNKKLIGWIKIEDTLIDYPVMQTVNNDYYLNHNFSQKEDRNGCIFMDYQCDVVNGCDNYILYGHHMKSGTMFGGLSKYASKDYYEKHPTIQFDTIYEKGEYQIMYVFRTKVMSEEDVSFKYYQFINASSEKEFNSAMNEMTALSLYDTGVTAYYGEQILTLSTCDYQENNGRFVVVAKKK